MRARLTSSHTVRSRVAWLARAGVVLGTSVVVARGVSGGAIYRAVVLGPVGVLFALLVASWALLFLALLAMRSIHFHPVLGPLTVTDALLVVFVIRRAWVVLSERRFKVSRANVWLLLFVMWAWLCTLSAGVAVTPLERLTLYAALSVILAADKDPDKRLILAFFLGYAVFEVVVSLPSQWATRLLGLHIGDPHQLSILCLAGLAPLLSRQFDFKGRRALLVLLLVATVLARARGPIVALAVALLLQNLGTMSRRRIIAAVACLVAGGALIYGPATGFFDLNNQSKDIREQSISRGVQAGLSSPLFGHGWSAQLAPGADQVETGDPDITGDQQPYNLFASAFAFLGFPGLVLLLLFISELIRSVADLDRTATLFCAAFLTLSLTEMTIYAQSLGTVIFFVYCGIGQRAASAVDKAAVPQHEGEPRTAGGPPAVARRARVYR